MSSESWLLVFYPIFRFVFLFVFHTHRMLLQRACQSFVLRYCIMRKGIRAQHHVFSICTRKKSFYGEKRMLPVTGSVPGLHAWNTLFSNGTQFLFLPIVRTMFIQTQDTLNKNSLKFLPGRKNIFSMIRSGLLLRRMGGTSQAVVQQRCGELLFQSPFVGLQRTMSVFTFLDHVWNRVDEERIKEVGPEIAAAEWIMRCGGSVKWKNQAKFITDYNQISISAGRNPIVEAIDASEACIMASGFEFFKNLSGVKIIKLHKTYQIDDVALRRLVLLKESLEELEISSCGDVSDNGLYSLDQLQKLKKLHLFDLPGVTNPQKCLTYLKKSLQTCQISFPPFSESN